MKMFEIYYFICDVSSSIEIFFFFFYKKNCNKSRKLQRVEEWRKFN